MKKKPYRCPCCIPSRLYIYNFNCHCHPCNRTCNKESPACELVGIQAQLETATPVNINDAEPIRFDKILKHSTKDITYNQNTGLFTLHAPGSYTVNWDISVEGSHHTSFIQLAITSGDNHKVEGASTLPLSVGQLSGDCLIRVKKPTTIQLTNTTGDIIQLSRYTPVANITITKVGESKKAQRFQPKR